MNNRSVRLPSEGLLQARQLLRNRQAKYPTSSGVARAIVDETTVKAALAHLNERRRFEPTDIPGIVRRDGFRFDRELEEKRIALAEDLVRRTDPGPFEDPTYLALLAYQAASLEMALPEEVDGRKVDMGWSRFLLGTIHAPELNAFAQGFISHNYTAVVLYSALIEFAYQAAKAVVAAQNPVRSADRRSFVSIDSRKEHLLSQLQSNPEPVERLYRTLEAYLFKGYPRAFFNETVPTTQMLPLGLLISMAERWVIGHEYGHGFAVGLKWEHVREPGLAEEYFADEQATILTVLSAARLDAVQPEFALAGGAFALATLEVAQRALSVVQHGEVLHIDDNGEHPPNKLRAEHIVDTFERYFELGPNNGPAGLDLNFVLRPEDWRLVETEETRQRRERVMHWPDVLFTIWDRVFPLLRKDFEAKRPLHPMWTKGPQPGSR